MVCTVGERTVTVVPMKMSGYVAGAAMALHRGACQTFSAQVRSARTAQMGLSEAKRETYARREGCR